jgi:hypothetical protein
MIDAAFVFFGHIILLGIGTAIFVLGLLQATHPPFQRWRYSSEWYNPGRKGPVDENSDDYQTALAHMRIAGSKFGGVGGLMMIYSLSQLGGERLLLIAGILFVSGLVLVGVYRLWQRVHRVSEKPRL